MRRRVKWRARILAAILDSLVGFLAAAFGSSSGLEALFWGGGVGVIFGPSCEPWSVSWVQEGEGECEEEKGMDEEEEDTPKAHSEALSSRAVGKWGEETHSETERARIGHDGDEPSWRLSWSIAGILGAIGLWHLGALLGLCWGA
eukprot:355215-Pyramimonas_sp.AAC.1